MSHFLAVDLGAESGRAMLGRLEQSRLELEELHRFPNQPVRLPDGLYWDSLRLFHEIREGLRVAGRERKLHLDGIGVDTWGVDFGLVDPAGRLVDAPRHYRDARNNGMLERTFDILPRERIFELTGLQFMQFNSLFQVVRRQTRRRRRHPDPRRTTPLHARPAQLLALRRPQE
jgi:rhamnulokinase